MSARPRRDEHAACRLYFAARHAGAPAATALNLDVLVAHAGGLDPGVTRLAGGLLLIGYGAKAGLFPFHTWLADAHSQAPAPVSALMSGVLLSVAFSVLIAFIVIGIFLFRIRERFDTVDIGVLDEFRGGRQ